MEGLSEEYEQKRKNRNDYMREYMRKRNQKLKQQMQHPTFVFKLDNAPLEFDYNSLEKFFEILVDVYKENVEHKIGKYVKDKEGIRNHFINCILQILDGGKVYRMLTPYGVLPNVEDENESSIESEEGGLEDNNLVLIKQNIENGDMEEIDEDENNKKKDISEYTTVYDISPFSIFCLIMAAKLAS